MIWGAADVTASTLSQVKQEGPYLLGFNEPDMASQSNMTPAQALSLWPQLMATGMQLGSPAVADDARHARRLAGPVHVRRPARGYRVNFITLHWYGADFATGAAVSQLQSYLQAVYARYHLPIWLTEFALANFGGSPATPTAAAAGRVPHGRDRDAAKPALRAALRLVRAAGHADRREHGPVQQRPGSHHGRPGLRIGWRRLNRVAPAEPGGAG